MNERQPIPLSRLNILVHPMFDRPRLEHDYAKAADLAYKNSLSRFSPKSASELLLIMPLVEGRGFSQVLKSYIRAKNTSRYGSWLEIYQAHKAKALDPQNVRLAPDIVHGYSVGDLETRLTNLGRSIDQQTEIVLGGEYEDYCVTSAALTLMRSPHISRVLVDKKVSVTFTGRVGGLLPHDDTSSMKHHQDTNFIYWEKKK